MKKITYILIAIIVVLTIVLIFIKPKSAVAPIDEVPTVNWSGRQCFLYHQPATPTAPYAVDEHLDITINEVNGGIEGGTVTGTKTGTQSGPDMTNGYTGKISGSVKNGVLVSVFDYTIEGSNNKEQEEYHFTTAGLVKKRYALVEKGGMLVPDKTSTPKDMLYAFTNCK